MRAPRREWTDEHVKTLKAMWASGATAVAIGLALGGRGEQSVRWKVGQMKMDRRPGGRQPSYGADSRRGLARQRNPQPGPSRRPKVRFTDTAPPIAFVDIRSGQCRWVEGDPCGPETLYCGRPTDRSSYCSGHASIAFRPVEVRA